MIFGKPLARQQSSKFPFHYNSHISTIVTLNQEFFQWTIQGAWKNYTIVFCNSLNK